MSFVRRYWLSAVAVLATSRTGEARYGPVERHPSNYVVPGVR